MPPRLVTSGATSSGAGTGTATASASATPSGSASAAQQVPVPIPGGSLVSFDQGAATAELTGLTRELVSGQAVMITFTFAKAGSVTLLVPVATPLGEVSTPSPVLTSSATG